MRQFVGTRLTFSAAGRCQTAPEVERTSPNRAMRLVGVATLSHLTLRPSASLLLRLGTRRIPSV